MERGKIVITRLRNSEYYKGERLNHIVDSIYHLCNNYIEKNPLYPNLYDSYNVSLLEIEKNRKNIRDINTIEQSNVLIIPTESEFAYHIYGRISNIMLGRGWTMVQNIREGLLRNPKPRKIILLSSDKADTIDLFKHRVFHDIPNLDFHRIDESEFPGGVHHLKYLAIKELNINTTKEKDFCYWGTSKKSKIDLTSEEKEISIKDWYDNKTHELTQKSNTKNNYLKERMKIKMLKGVPSLDERHIILKEIMGDETITKNMIGYFDGFKYTHKFDKNMKNILPHLAECKFTLCFNWPGQEEHLTSRYNEALACDVIPLVWQNYDCNNQLVLDDRQRMFSFEDIKKCLKNTTESRRLKWLEEIKEKYLNVTKPIEHYEELFNKKLKKIIED